MYIENNMVCPAVTLHSNCILSFIIGVNWVAEMMNVISHEFKKTQMKPDSQTNAKTTTGEWKSR